MVISTGTRASRTTEQRLLEVILSNEDEFIQGLKPLATESILGGIGISGNTSSNIPTNPSGNFLERAGDFMVGPIGFDSVLLEIANNELDVSSLTTSFKGKIIMNAEGGPSIDDLERIVGGTNQFPGRASDVNR